MNSSESTQHDNVTLSHPANVVDSHASKNEKKALIGYERMNSNKSGRAGCSSLSSTSNTTGTWGFERMLMRMRRRRCVNSGGGWVTHIINEDYG